MLKIGGIANVNRKNFRAGPRQIPCKVNRSLCRNVNVATASEYLTGSDLSADYTDTNTLISSTKQLPIDRVQRFVVTAAITRPMTPTTPLTVEAALKQNGPAGYQGFAVCPQRGPIHPHLAHIHFDFLFVIFAKAKRYTDITELTPELLRLFIQKIVVHEKSMKWSKKRLCRPLKFTTMTLATSKGTFNRTRKAPGRKSRRNSCRGASTNRRYLYVGAPNITHTLNGNFVVVLTRDSPW